MTDILKILLEVTIYSSVLAGVLLLLRALFKKKISAKLQYMAWLLLIVRLMIPVTVESGFHFWKEPAVTAQEVAEETVKRAEQAEAARQEEAMFQAEKTPQQMVIENIVTAPSAPVKTETHTVAKKPAIEITWQQIVFGLWILGAVALGGFFIRTRVRFMRKIKATMQLPTAEMQREYDRICEEMMLKEAPQLVVCDVQSPALIGNKVLIPENLTGQALRYALYHELTHYRRKDHIMVVLMSALRCVYWFNPLVWIAFSAMQTDMEVACDAGVMERIGAEEKRGYLTTLLNMFSAHSVPAIGMAQAQSKTAAKERIEGAFRKRRTGRGMRMVSAIVACIILVCCFTTACQPTPEKPVVINKNNNTLENTIADLPAPEVEVAPTEETEGGMIVSEHWTETFERNGITVNIDADILTPNVSKYPVYRVDALRLDEKFVEEKVKIFLEQGFEVTNGSTFEGYGSITKEDIMRKIIHLKQEIDKLKKGIGDPVDLDISIEEQLKTAEEALKRWEKDYNDPNYNGGIDPLPLIYDPIAFTEIGFGGPTYTVKDSADNKYVLYFCIDQTTGGFPQEQMYFAKDMENYQMAGAVTSEEAQKMSYDFLAMMGMEEDYIYYSETEPVTANYMTYTHNYDGIPENQEWTCSGPSVVESNQYTEMIYRENMNFMVDQNGLVSFSWAWPYKVIETENRNVSMKSLEEIKEIFRNQIFFNTAYFDFEDTKQINIHTIRLGYCVTYVKNEKAYRMVPVWDFVGIEESTGDNNAAGSFVTLNAIDGSNINRNEGY